MRGGLEIVRSDADQPWHVRLAAESTEKISTSEQLVREHTAVENLLAQARCFGYDTPHFVRLSAETGLLRSGLTISGGVPIERDVVIGYVRIVDERASPEPPC